MHSCPRCILRFLGFTGAAFLLLALAVFLARGPILRNLTYSWIIDEPVSPADAIVVLGGGVNTRTFAAAEYYQRKLSARILIPRVKPSPVEALGLIKSHTELCREVVVAKNVPNTAIHLIGTDVSSTWEEATALRKWALDENASHLIIPTEFPYTRRLRWIMDQTFEGTKTKVTITAIEPLEYNRSNWWTTEEGLINVQNELLKYLLYRMKY